MNYVPDHCFHKTLGYTVILLQVFQYMAKYMVQCSVLKHGIGLLSDLVVTLIYEWLTEGLV